MDQTVCEGLYCADDRIDAELMVAALQRAGLGDWQVAPWRGGSARGVGAEPPEGAMIPADDAWRLARRVSRHAGAEVTPLLGRWWSDGAGVQGPCAIDDVAVAKAAIGATGAGSGVRIGHPDTGFTAHPELREKGPGLRDDLGLDLLDGDGSPLDPREWVGDWFDGHGTSTASVAAGVRVGCAPGAELVPIRMTRSVLLITQTRLAAAIEHAVDVGCKVVLLCLGGPPSARLRSVLDLARQHGVIVVAAAGNEVGLVAWPAAWPDVIGVAAVDYDGRAWRGTSRGPGVDIAAPGVAVPSAQWRADVATICASTGTSMAASLVAGAAALWLERHGGWDALRRRYRVLHRIPAAFRACLVEGAAPHVDASPGLGAGRLWVPGLLAAPLPAEGLDAPPGPGPALLDALAARVGPSAEEVMCGVFGCAPSALASRMRPVEAEIRDVLTAPGGLVELDAGDVAGVRARLRAHGSPRLARSVARATGVAG
jgi:subtilisin family serine protease